MSSLLNQEYFHIGTSHIRDELWENIHMDQKYSSYIKPYGGLWTSHNCMDIGRISDWLDYLEDDEFGIFANMTYQNGCLVKFCDDARFLKIQNENDFQNLRDSGFTIPNVSDYPEILDYEKLSSIYDLLYISPFAHPSLRNYSICSMITLRSRAIEYYREVYADYPKQRIIEVGDPKRIPPVSIEYLDLKNEITKRFQDNFSYESYADYIYKLEQYKKWFCCDFKSSHSNTKLPNEVWKYDAIDIILQNLYCEKSQEKKRILKEAS